MLTSAALRKVCVCAPSLVGNKKIKSENGSVLQDMAFHVELYFTLESVCHSKCIIVRDLI